MGLWSRRDYQGDCGGPYEEVEGFFEKLPRGSLPLQRGLACRGYWIYDRATGFAEVKGLVSLSGDPYNMRLWVFAVCKGGPRL